MKRKSMGDVAHGHVGGITNSGAANLQHGKRRGGVVSSPNHMKAGHAHGGSGMGRHHKTFGCK